MRIEPLLVDPAQRFEFHQLMEAGLEQSGELAGAFQHALQLVQDQPLQKALVAVSPVLKTQPSQVAAPRLGELYSKVAPADRKPLDQKVDAWIAKLAKQGTAKALQQAAITLRELPATDRVERALVEKLSAKGDAAELMGHLHAMRQSTHPETAAYATAQWLGSSSTMTAAI